MQSDPPAFQPSEPPVVREPDPPPRAGSRNGRRVSRPQSDAKKKPTRKKSAKKRKSAKVPVIGRGVPGKRRTATEVAASSPSVLAAMRLMANVMPEDHEPLFDIADRLNALDKASRKRVLAALNGMYV